MDYNLLLKMNKQIKVLMSVIVLVLLVQGVYAGAFATIGMQGLSMASPEVAELINVGVCVSNPIVCAEGKIVGQVYGEALQTLAEQSPEAAKAITTYNQVQGYIDQGAEIVEELQVDEGGQVIEGTMQFKDEEGRFGNLIGKDIEQDKIYGKEIELNKKEGVSTISFTGENSYINVKDDLFKDIKASGEDNEAYIKLNEEGNIKEADITASKDTSFVFGEKRIDVKEGTRVFYQDGKITINGQEGEEVNLMDKVTDENGEYTFSNANKVKILDSKGRLSINGNIIRGTDFQIGDLRVRAESAAEIGEVTLVPEGYLLGKKSIGEWKGMNLITDKNVLLATSKNGLENYDSWILPDTKRLQAKGEGFEILFNEDNEWVNVNENGRLKLDFEKKIKINIENRNNENLAPLFSITRDKDSLLNIQDGDSYYSYKNDVDVNKAIFKKSLNSEGVGDYVPLELKDALDQDRGSWYLDNSGNVVDSIYRVSNEIDVSLEHVTPEELEKFRNGGRIYLSPAVRAEGFTEAKVLMDKNGNIKYPIYKAFAEANFKSSGSRGENMQEFIESVESNQEEYYLDESSLKYIEDHFWPTSDIKQMQYWKELVKIYPEDQRLKNIALNDIMKDKAEGRNEVFYGKNLPRGWISLGSEADETIPKTLETFKNHKDLQMAFLENTDLTIKDRDYDENLLINSLRNSADGEVFNTLLSKYGLKPNEEESLNWKATYALYNGFDSNFPDYKDIGLSDTQKLQFVKEGVFKSNFGKDFSEPLPIREVEKIIKNYVGNKDKVIFDDSYELFMYNYPSKGVYMAEENFGYLEKCVTEKGCFQNTINRDVNKDGFSLKNLIKKDLASPSEKKIYLFNNHGGPNTQYVGAHFYGWSIDLSDSDVAESLFKGYIDSSKDPNERTFGDKVIICESCYSGDFIENVQEKLENMVIKTGVNSENIKLPTLISISDKGKVGYSANSEEYSISLNLMKLMEEKGGKITVEDFIKERDKMLEEQYMNNPQILTDYN
jgi:hypothetical protein